MAKKKTKKKPPIKWLKYLPLIPLVLSTLIVFSYLGFLFYYQDKILPGIKIGRIPVGGQNPQTTLVSFKGQFQDRLKPLSLSYQEQQYTINLSSASAQLDLNQQLNQAYLAGHSGNIWRDLIIQVRALIWGITFTPQVTFKNKPLLLSQLNQINQSVKKEPVKATINLGDQITITPDTSGLELDDLTLLKQIEDFLNFTADKPTILPIKTIPAQFTVEDAKQAQLALEKIANSPIELNYQTQTWTINQSVLFNLLNFNKSHPLPLTGEASPSALKFNNSTTLLDKDKLADYLKKLTAEINKPVAEAKFEFDSGSGRVKAFQAASEGQELDLNQTAILINQALDSQIPPKITLPVKVTLPKIKTADVNNLGIKEIIGQGQSNFAGSIQNRIFNLGLAASRVNGVLVPPGEVFSFNQTVGDISAASGYKQAYIIKEGRTVLDDGGGVCQVSTTLFRAALNAGLPVLERTAHAYRVGYYEQGYPPGLDATVFAPSVDFKFKNDTPNHILIQSYINGPNLYFDLYGTLDNRVVELSKPVILNQTPPLPELRQDDPTLPRGTIKQVDWPAWGANVSFKRTVVKDGQEIINETWRSNYKSWQAIYLVGTKD